MKNKKTESTKVYLPLRYRIEFIEKKVRKEKKEIKEKIKEMKTEMKIIEKKEKKLSQKNASISLSEKEKREHDRNAEKWFKLRDKIKVQKKKLQNVKNEIKMIESWERK